MFILINVNLAESDHMQSNLNDSNFPFQFIDINDQSTDVAFILLLKSWMNNQRSQTSERLTDLAINKS